MNDNLVTIIVPLITGICSYLAGANTNKTTLQKALDDNDANMEKFYAGEMGSIIAEYKEQVSGFREELRQVKQEFSDFKKQHEKEVTGYKNRIEFLEEENEALEIENEHLKAENSELEDRVAYLKGES